MYDLYMFTRHFKKTIPWIAVSFAAAFVLFLATVANSWRKTYKRINSDYGIRPYE